MLQLFLGNGGAQAFGGVGAVLKGAQGVIGGQRALQVAGALQGHGLHQAQIARAALEGRHLRQVGSGQVKLALLEGVQRGAVQRVIRRILVFSQLAEQLGGGGEIPAAQVQLGAFVVIPVG